MTGKSQGLGNTGAEARNAPYERLPLRDADIRYFLDFFEQETTERYFQALLREAAWEQRTLLVYGKRHPEPRLTAWYGDEGAEFSYSVPRGTHNHGSRCFLRSSRPLSMRQVSVTTAFY